MSFNHREAQGHVITAKTLSGIGVTINDSEIIITGGKPLIMFFVVDDNGQHGIFNQNQLTDYQEN